MPNYRVKIERYRNNEMSSQEAESFEKEIRDAAALFDYLMEKEDIDEFSHELGSDDLFKSEQEVKQKVRKRIVRLAISISLIVLLVVGCAFFLVPKIIDRINYNPLQGQVLSNDGFKSVEEPSSFELFSRIENQIFPKGDRLVGTSIDRIGAGKYSILREYYNDFRGSRNASKDIIARGVLEQGVSVATHDLSLIYGNRSGIETEEIVSKDSVLNSKIAMLPDSSWVKVTLTFTAPKKWNELKDFMGSHEEVVFYNAIIDSSAESADEIGIRLALESANNLDSFTSMSRPYSHDFIKKVEKDYPRLLQQVTNTATEDEIKQFLTSNIQYLLDHSEDNLDRANIPKADNTNSNSNQEAFKLLVDQIKTDELFFSKIQVSLPKDQFSTFVTDKEFFYATLDDLALFSTNK